MSELSSMDLPTTEVDLGPEKIEDEKEAGPLFHCDLCDTEVTHKVAQMLLPGLATACVDNTTGHFKTPDSVAADLRKEMIDYLTQRSESFVAEFVILEGGPDGEVLDNPFDIISNFVDDFVSLRRNLFSRVSGWLLSERREDKIDDIIQEMEINGFWSLYWRETVAGTLLKNVDFNNSFHCGMKCNSLEELANHAHNCSFRTIICQNEGCDARFCASQLEKHDSTCPFKIIPCEQKCSDSIMRREMDRHCITICPMKLVNCPFYAVGCQSPIPKCMIEKHRSDELHSHLLYTLQGIYKEASEEDLKPRVEQIVQASSNIWLAEARDARSLTFIVKDIDAKLEPLEITSKKKNVAENNDENEDSEDSNIKEKGSELDIETSNMENSSDRAEGFAIINKDSVENNTKNENSDINKKGNEQSKQTSNMSSSSDKAEVSAIMNKDSAEKNVKNEDSEHNCTDKSNEKSTETSKVANLSDKAEIGDVNSAQVYNQNKDAEDSMKITGNEESIETSKMANLSDKVEVSYVNSAQVYNKNKDAEDSMKIKGNEDSTETKMRKNSDKVDITVKDTAENNINNKSTKDNKFQDKDNVESVQTSKMEYKGSAENNIKNKDIGDNTIGDEDREGSIQISKVENLSDKAEVSAMKKDSAESIGS